LIENVRDWWTTSGIGVVGNGEIGVLLVAIQEDSDVVETCCYVGVVASENGWPR